MEQIFYAVIWGLAAGLASGITGLSGVLGLCAVILLLEHLGWSSPGLKQLFASYPFVSIEAALVAAGGLGALIERHRHQRIPWSVTPSYAVGALAGAWAGSMIAWDSALPALRVISGVIVVVLAGIFLVTGAAPGRCVLPLSGVALTGALAGFCLPWLGFAVVAPLMIGLVIFHRIPPCFAHGGAEAAALIALVGAQLGGAFTWPAGPGIHLSMLLMVVAAFAGGRSGSRIAHRMSPIWVEKLTAASLAISGLRILTS